MDFLKLRDGVELYYKRDIPSDPKGIVLINHGFAEHLGRYDYTANVLKENNYIVYRYDLRGHGRTKSKLGHINSFNDFIEDCHEMVEIIKREREDLPIFMLGHSMGGLITTLYGIKYKGILKGQIFSGAALGTLPSATNNMKKILPITNKFFKKIMIKNPIDDSLCSDKQVFINYVNDPLVLKRASMNFYVEFLINSIKNLNIGMKDYNYPCLILHGGDDRIVPKELSKNFYENISSIDKEIKLYNGLYHEILNEKKKDQILEDMILWLNNRV